jgi:hypothetical protein
MSEIWNNTQGYGRTAATLEYLDAAQNARLERIRIARALRKGWHRKVYLDEGRTQFDFPEMEVQGAKKRPYITFNVLKLITTTITDLLLGEEPMLRVDGDEMGEQWQDILDTLRNRTNLHSVIYDAVKSASWSAEGFCGVRRWDEQVYVQDVRPDELFPIGERLPDGQHAAYRRYATAIVARTPAASDTPAEKLKATITLLLETTFTAGKITRQCFELDGTRKVRDVDLALWPTKKPDGNPLDSDESTGIEWNTVIWLPNELEEGEPTSDYDGLVELQDELNAKQTQIARVIAKHSDPAVIADERLFNEQGQLKIAGRVFSKREGAGTDAPLQYVTWNADLANAIEDRDFTLNSLCIAAELSQGLLGLERGGAPDSARKLRLQATKALARMKRKAVHVKPFVRTVIDTALMMEAAGKRTQIALGGFSAVDLRDGLPVDELDQATVISTLTGNKPTMSIERAVRTQIQDEAAAAEEIGLLKAAQDSATPTVLFGEPEVAGQGDRGEGADEGVRGQGSGDSTDATTPEAEVTGQELQTSQATVLNGAQVTAATAIVTAVAAGEIPRDAGMGQLKIFYNLTDEQATQVMGSAGTSTPTTPNPKPADAGTQNPAPRDGGAA